MPDIVVTDCGALGDGSGRKITAAELSALHPIGQHYQPGVDTIDLVGCQEGIYRAFGPPGNENGASYRRNKRLKFPGGEYVLNRPLELRYVQGGTIEGDGEFATTLTGTNKSGGEGGASVLYVNGMSYSGISAMQLRQAPGTGAPGGALLTLDYDGTSPPSGWHAEMQGNVFQRLYLSGEGYGNRSSGVYAYGHYRMGSENLWQACSFIWFDYGYYGDRSFNSLQNCFQGGNFANCRKRAILIRAGSVACISVGFQCGDLGTQLTGADTPVDIELQNSAGDVSYFTYCRSESARFLRAANDHKAVVTACNVLPGLNRWRAGVAQRTLSVIMGTHAKGVGCIYIAEKDGTTGTTEPDWATAGEHVTDGTVTWKRSDHNIIDGGLTDVTACVLTFGRTAVDYIDRCEMSRKDWPNMPTQRDGGHNRIWLNGHANDSRGIVTP
ncbi:MAG TPA: hypothetical protein VNV25_02705 [Gemmatimonadaceae bacterium]|jgi:hypothetical protein|nr:hypothetical protein [Gemmatimonadaceae bacterium]